MTEFIARETGNNLWPAKAVTENSIVRVRGKVGRLTNVHRRKLLLIYDAAAKCGMSVEAHEQVEVLKWAGALAADWLAAHTDKQGSLLAAADQSDATTEQAG